MAAPIQHGINTIHFGTNASMWSKPATAIIESISITPKNSGPIAEIEDGEGGAVTTVYLDDGFTAEITCVHNHNVAWPNVAEIAMLRLPAYGVAAQAAGAYAPANFNGSVAAISGDYARKRESKVKISFVYRPQITGAQL